MASEIEHKFLVNIEALPKKLPRGERLIQGYLCTNPMVRVRVISGARKARAFLTIKGRGFRVRAEYEYPIRVSDARKLLKLCERRIVEKIRRRMDGWEL